LIARDLPDLYRGADLFAMTSFNEGMSNAMLEAMASGLPVLVTRTAGTAEIVEEGVNGWTLAWQDAATLTARLTHAVARRDELAALGAAAREKVSRFTWGAAAQRYLKLLESIA
jgi:phosphatidylinositol alpha-1,6-mannosyltransferase